MLIDAEDYRRWDAVELTHLVREGELTAEDLAQTARALLDQWHALNAVAAVVPQTETAPAPAVTREADAPPFAGVPFAVKELLAWPGLPWTMGSRLFAANQAPGWSPYAQALAGAGLEVICSTTSSEFGLLGSTETALHGATLNPWGAGLSAGGSSGGSAALVAAGILPMAHGSDAGGSLRVPAGLCGIFGFKPSNGRCLPTGPDSQGPDAPGLASLVVEHVMTRSVRDSAQVLALTQRSGAGAVHPPLGLVRGPDPGSRRLRIALLTPTLLGEQPEDVVLREVHRAATVCAGLGHEVDVARQPGVDGEAVSQAFFTSAALTMAQVWQLASAMLGRPPGPQELEPFSLELIEWAATLGPDSPGRTHAALVDGARAYLQLFQGCDVVLSPTLARRPWPLGYLSPAAGRQTLVRRTEQAVGYTPIHNIAGCPAMSVPLGENDGVPVGVHFAAAPGADALLLRLAYELEEAAPWADRRPDLGRLAQAG